MTTDKELADAYRLVLNDRDQPIGMPHEEYKARIQQLDPPKPTYPDGTIAVVAYDKGDDNARAVYARRSNGKWREADSAWFCFDNQVTSVTPLRVLGDDEIAVKRFEVDYMGPCDTTAKFMREAANRAAKLDHGSNVTRAVQKVLRGYADALDAEAGGQS